MQRSSYPREAIRGSVYDYIIPVMSQSDCVTA
jgi:hypothetical protein